MDGDRGAKVGVKDSTASNVARHELREMILHLIRNDDEVKQAILDLIRREAEKRTRRGGA